MKLVPWRLMPFRTDLLLNMINSDMRNIFITNIGAIVVLYDESIIGLGVLFHLPADTVGMGSYFL